MNVSKKIHFLLVTGACSIVGLHAFAPTNFFEPYDVTLRLDQPDNTSFKLGANVEHGYTCKGQNLESIEANVLRLYDDTQATIPMLFSPVGPNAAAINDKFLQLTTAYAGQPLDDGVRGHIALDGKFEQTDLTVHGKYLLPLDMIDGDLSISLHMPIRWARMYRLASQDQTRDIFMPDLELKRLVTTDLAANLKDLGGLDIGQWSDTGLGDLVFMVNWINTYRQDKDHLKDVTLAAKLGLSMPTGLEKDEDKAFSLPFGNDGAWGIPIGVGIDLDFVHHVRLGGEAEFLILFDKTRTRRLRTDNHQTDFFLLSKGRATKDHGLTWKFNLYMQGYHFWRGLSLKFGYHYIKHDDDRLTAKSDDFSYSVINSAKDLIEWNAHDLIFQLNYDFFQETKNFAVKPQLSLFYKLPIDGKAVINANTFGGQFGLNF
jgi:hypothetical protein